jgi:dTDP-4-dehydrorhamnose reductase
LDISDTPASLSLVERIRPDVIFNCASYTNVDACETNRDIAMLANAIGPRNMAMAANRIGAKLIHISTDYVFSGTEEGERSEWDVCAPQSVYGHTKHLGEQYVRTFCSRHFIVRTAWLYGYEGGNFVKTILRNGKERGSLKVVNDQFGNPTHASDLAHHLLKLAVTEEYGLYHCTGNGTCSWYDFACAIVRHAGISCAVTPCTSEEFPTPAKRPTFSALDNRMLRCTIGNEMRNWESALAAYMAHYDRESGDIRL